MSRVRGNDQGALAPTVRNGLAGFGRKWTRLSVAVGLAAAGVAWVAAPAWADSSIQSSGPLTSITTTSDLNCAVTVDGDTQGEWYGNTACGTFLAVGSQVFGPAVVPAGPTFTAWKPVSQTAVTGTGVAGDPFTVVTVVDAGQTGLRVTQTDTYVSGSQQYTTKVTVASTATVSKNVVLYRAGDCYQQDSDTGYGRVDGTSVACVAEVPFSGAPSTRLEQLIPLTPGSSYIEGRFSADVWNAVAGGQPLPNTCLCSNDPVDDVDNGVGLSWAVTIAPGSQVTERQATYFSPTPLSTSVTADDPTVLPGATDGYTVTVSNPASTDATLATITDTLPDGFSYIPGSTTGVTTADPSIAGQVLTWNGAFTVAAGGSSQLHFQVQAATALGTYFDSAGGTIGGTGDRTVNSSGPTAQIDVQPVAVTGLTPDALVVGATNVDVMVTGTMFSPDATISLGAGVLVNSVNVQDETTLTANVSVAADATPGARDVVLTEADGTATCTGCFAVHAQPTITSITPSSRGQGAKQQQITIIGTKFVTGAQVTVSGNGVTVTGITQTRSTKIVATVSVSAGAAPGARTLTVTDPDRGVATGTFSVNPGPKPASASPSVSRGTSQDVVITGTNFVAGLSVKVAAAGVTVSAPSVVTSTSITVTVTASATTSPGTYKLTVTNPDRGVGSKVCLTIV